jgi:hypothetical protein
MVAGGYDQCPDVAKQPIGDDRRHGGTPVAGRTAPRDISSHAHHDVPKELA